MDSVSRRMQMGLGTLRYGGREEGDGLCGKEWNDFRRIYATPYILFWGGKRMRFEIDFEVYRCGCGFCCVEEPL